MVPLMPNNSLQQLISSPVHVLSGHRYKLGTVLDAGDGDTLVDRARALPVIMDLRIEELRQGMGPLILRASMHT